MKFSDEHKRELAAFEATMTAMINAATAILTTMQSFQAAMDAATAGFIIEIEKAAARAVSAASIAEQQQVDITPINKNETIH